jgi:hypothetical protein
LLSINGRLALGHAEPILSRGRSGTETSFQLAPPPSLEILPRLREQRHKRAESVVDTGLDNGDDTCGFKNANDKTGKQVGDAQQVATKERHALSLKIPGPPNDCFSREETLSLKHASFPSSSKPRKLRKRPSSIPSHLHIFKVDSTIESPGAILRLDKKIRSVHDLSVSGAERSGQDLPMGIEQRGKGIGFTFMVPAANHSNISICTTTPEACHGFFRRGFSLGPRKDNQQGIQGNRITRKFGFWNYGIKGEERQSSFVPRQSYDNPLGPGLSTVFFSSPSSETAVDSSTSVTTTNSTSNNVADVGCCHQVEAGGPNAALHPV